MLNNIYGMVQAVLDQACEDHVFPGAVVGCFDANTSSVQYWKTGTLLNESAGQGRDSVAQNRADEHTVYDVASVTKSVVTSTLALQKIDRGEWQLTDKLVELWPALEQFTHLSDIRLSHLLTHTVPFAIRLSQLKNLPAAEIRQQVLAAPLLAPPGTQYAYINATSMVLGWLLAEVSGVGLAALFQQEIAIPLGMFDTTFTPSEQGDEYLNRVAPTEIDPWRGGSSEALRQAVLGGLVRGQVHDESAWVFAQAGQAVGSAGLFSTAQDLVAFGTALLAGQVVSPVLTAQLAETQFPELGMPIGLGWELNQPWMSEHAGPRTIGKTGFTGCSVVIDLERARVIVLLSNSTYPHRPATKDGITAVRKAVMSSLLE
jgi:CubicO group peptidase (beta-lactamase class C family)